jgi:hypothetical protein
MTASTFAATVSTDTFNAVGLVVSHAYTVLSYITLYNADGTTKAQLVKMRNPWGIDSLYNGTWNDNDATWNTVDQTYATQAGLSSNTNDGIFYISINDFVTYFQGLVISMYKTNYVSSTAT